MNMTINMLALASVFALSTLQTVALDKTITKKKMVVKVSKKSVPIWSKNVKIPHRAWIPVDKPKEVLLCVHGLGFSSESFTEFGRAMAGHGIAVYAVDVRGFGQWTKTQDKNVDFEACLLDVEAALKSLHKAYGQTPIFLVGESMGGGIALQATSRNPQLVYGLICSVPSSDRYAKFSSEIVVGTRYLSNKNKPMDMTTEVVNRSTSDVKLRKAWANESSNRMKLTPKELKQFTDFMKGNEDAAALIDKTPSLMLAGFKDKLIKPEGTIDLFNELNTPDKLLMVVGDGEHLLLEENQMSDQLEEMIIVWIKNQLTSKQRSVNARLSEGR